MTDAGGETGAFRGIYPHYRSTSTMTKILHNGCELDFDAVVHLMDDDILHALHARFAEAWPDTSEQQFFDAYCTAHRAKFGEDFVIT